MKRAITDDAKELKSKYILEKAYKIYKESTFQDIKMIDIAEASGVSKGTIFNYFNTKEELFLELLISKYKEWFSNLNNALIDKGKMSINVFVDFFIHYLDHSIKNNDVLYRLNSILHTVLETNISYEKAVRFKKFLYENIEQTGDIISKSTDQLTKEQGVHIMLTLHAMVVGYMNMANTPDVIGDAIVNNKLEAFKIDFRMNFLKTFRMYLIGLIRTGQEGL